MLCLIPEGTFIDDSACRRTCYGQKFGIFFITNRPISEFLALDIALNRHPEATALLRNIILTMKINSQKINCSLFSTTETLTEFPAHKLVYMHFLAIWLDSRPR